MSISGMHIFSLNCPLCFSFFDHILVFTGVNIVFAKKMQILLIFHYLILLSACPGDVLVSVFYIHGLGFVWWILLRMTSFVCIIFFLSELRLVRTVVVSNFCASGVISAPPDSELDVNSDYVFSPFGVPIFPTFGVISWFCTATQVQNLLYLLGSSSDVCL